MNIKKQFLVLFLILIFSQMIGQLLPPFSMLIGTPLLVPLAGIIICFFLGEKSAHFDFETKSGIIIILTFLSAQIDYLYTPGTHDQIGFAWMTLFWSYGLFVLFFGLILAKIFKDFSLTKIGLNVWTIFSILEVIIFISIPLIYIKLLNSGQIVSVIGNS